VATTGDAFVGCPAGRSLTGDAGVGIADTFGSSAVVAGFDETAAFEVDTLLTGIRRAVSISPPDPLAR